MGVENNIPEGWKEVPLKEILLKRNQGVNTTTEKVIYSTKGHRVVKAQDILERKINFSVSDYVDRQEYARLSTHVKPKLNDILYSNIGSKMGNAAKVKSDFQFIIAWNVLRLQINTDEAEVDFLVQLLNSKTIRRAICSLNSSSTMPFVSGGVIELFEINLPPLPEQKAIAKVLTAFDDKIELLQAQNKTLETMAQTIFNEWFGKYQIGDELPDGWKVGILDDLFGELATGNRPKGGVGNLSSGVPSIGAESIGGISNFDYSKTKYVSKEFFLNMKRGIVKEYDILIYKDGGTPGTFIPKFSMFGEGFPFKEFCINSHVFRVQPKKIHHRFYIYQWLNSYYCKWQLKNIGGKAAIPGINSTDLKNLDVIIPCDKLLYKYHDLVKNKYKKILKNMVQIQSLTKTRDTLLPKLMSGQVRVNNINEESNIVSGDLIEGAEGTIPNNIVDDGPKINLF